jgi:hypothetical protein
MESWVELLGSGFLCHDLALGFSFGGQDFSSHSTDLTFGVGVSSPIDFGFGVWGFSSR